MEVVVPAAPDDTSGLSQDAVDPTPRAPAARRAPRLRLVLLGVLVLAVLASGVLLVWLLAGRRGDAEQVQERREEVQAQARAFMLRINTYGPDLLEGSEMPEYREGVAALITPKFDADFEENVPAAEATVAQGGLSRTAVVWATGVSDADDDSATALVVGSFTNSYPAEQGSTERVDADPSPFRVQVELVRTDGRWLVDDFTPVNAAEDGSGGLEDLPQPSADPTTDPTTAPSGGATP